MKVYMGRVDDMQIWIKLQQYQKEDVTKLLSISGGSWDPKARYWRYPFLQKKIRQLYDCFPQKRSFQVGRLPWIIYLLRL
ncbi:hypothetical protein D3C78_547190 [compost metagenome]